MTHRAGFFPTGQCRHYQLVDGWAKLWCTRTENGHTEHETAGGARWAPSPDREICDHLLTNQGECVRCGLNRAEIEEEDGAADAGPH